MTQPYRQTLISSRHNIDLGAFEVHSRQVTPKCAVPWSVKKVRLRGGRQEGCSLVEIRNGRWTMRVVPTRGMNILDVVADDVRLGWHSAVEEVVHPKFIELGARGGTGWLAGFNEMLVRCGLEWFGPPGEEPYHLAAGEPPVGQMTLHGRVANIPASELELVVETSPPNRIRLRGEVNEVMHYGPKLRLTTEIIAEPGAASFTVDDTITNLGGQTQEFGVLYHANYGRHILEPGAKLVAPIKRVVPRNEVAAAGVETFADYGPPRAGSLEQVFLMTLYGDRRGQTEVMLQNKARDRAVSMAWPLGKLPCFTVWKALHAEADGYVTGLEPGTSYPLPRPIEREQGRVPQLRAGESHRAAIEFSIHSGKRDVAAVARRIASIGRGRKARVDAEPGGFG